MKQLIGICLLLLMIGCSGKSPTKPILHNPPARMSMLIEWDDGEVLTAIANFTEGVWIDSTGTWRMLCSYDSENRFGVSVLHLPVGQEAVLLIKGNFTVRASWGMTYSGSVKHTYPLTAPRRGTVSGYETP